MAQQMNLMQMSAFNIPFVMIPHLFDFEKRVIHRELAPFVRARFRRYGPLERLCDCGQNGECLCYFGAIRYDMIEQYWGEETDYIYLGQWC